MKGEIGTRWTSTEPLSEMNVVPMVDVFMVILLIFMITAPVISQTLDVQLPRASLSPGTRADQTLIISVDRTGVVALNNRVLGPLRKQQTVLAFEREVNRWKAANPGAPAFLRADRRLRYGSVIQVMALLRRMGVVDVGLMIEREAG